MTPNLLNITPELTASVATKTAAAKVLLADIAHNLSLIHISEPTRPY